MVSGVHELMSIVVSCSSANERTASSGTTNMPSTPMVCSMTQLRQVTYHKVSGRGYREHMKEPMRRESIHKKPEAMARERRGYVPHGLESESVSLTEWTTHQGRPPGVDHAKGANSKHTSDHGWC